MVDKENSRYLSSVGKACYQKKRNKKKKKKKDQCMSVITIIQVRIEKYKKNVCINKEETFLASISQFGVRRRSLV